MKVLCLIFALPFILLFSACSEPKQQDNTQFQQPQDTSDITNPQLANNAHTNTPITPSPTSEPINFQAASDIHHNQSNNLPPSCQHYHQIATHCFANQNNAQGLQNMLTEQMQALAQQTPTESECKKLYQSFHAVTQKLNCHLSHNN